VRLCYASVASVGSSSVVGVIVACMASMACSSARAERRRRSKLHLLVAPLHRSLTYCALARSRGAQKSSRIRWFSRIPSQRIALHSTCAVGRARHTRRLISTRTDITGPDIEILFDYLERHRLRYRRCTRSSWHGSYIWTEGKLARPGIHTARTVLCPSLWSLLLGMKRRMRTHHLVPPYRENSHESLALCKP
jgi:hypothetical protein